MLQAAHEKRLALITSRHDLLEPSGLVLRAADVHLPDAVMKALTRRYADLNTTYVLAVGWRWAVVPSDDEVFTYDFVLAAGAIFGTVALLCAVLLVYHRRRQRALETHCRTLLERHRSAAARSRRPAARTRDDGERTDAVGGVDAREMVNRPGSRGGLRS